METFTMSRKEVPRAGLVKAALAAKITTQEGARALRLSVRQFKRLKARFRREGARGLVHRRRGQPCRPPRPGRHADDNDLPGLQRRPSHRETHARPCPAREPRDRAPDSPGPRAAAPAPPPPAPAPEPGRPRPRD